MAQGVKTHRSYPQGAQQCGKTGPVVSGLQRGGSAGHKVVVFVSAFLQRTKQPAHLRRQGNISHGAAGLGQADFESVHPFIPGAIVYPAEGFADVQDAGTDVDIPPLKGADLADAHAALQAKQYAQIARIQIAFQVPEEMLLVLPAQQRQRLRGPGFRRITDLEIRGRPGPQLHAEPQYHPQDQDDILNRAGRQAISRKGIDKRLNVLAVYCGVSLEPRQYVLARQRSVKCIG